MQVFNFHVSNSDFLLFGGVVEIELSILRDMYECGLWHLTCEINVVCGGIKTCLFEHLNGGHVVGRSVRGL